MSDGPPPPRVWMGFNGPGWHPAAGELTPVDRRESVRPSYWVDRIAAVQRSGVDAITFADRFGWADSEAVVPRLDAVLLAARMAPTTDHLGLLPVVTVEHTEPFHVSKAIATLDYVTGGWAGVGLRTSVDPDEAALFGRRTGSPPTGAETAEFIEVLRRLWDSWEDDAEIRDVATGRFIDRDKVHHIDYAGDHFSVAGPSITPRSPQGQPIVAAELGVGQPTAVLASGCDVVFVPSAETESVRESVRAIRAAEHDLDRPGAPVRIFADVVAHVDAADDSGRARRERLDQLRPAGPAGISTFAGTPSALLERIAGLARTGVTGVRLLPATMARDLPVLLAEVLPALRPAAEASPPTSLRARLALERPPSRYAGAPSKRPGVRS